MRETIGVTILILVGGCTRSVDAPRPAARLADMALVIPRTASPPDMSNGPAGRPDGANGVRPSTQATGSVVDQILGSFPNVDFIEQVKRCQRGQLFGRAVRICPGDLRVILFTDKTPSPYAMIVASEKQHLTHESCLASLKRAMGEPIAQMSSNPWLTYFLKGTTLAYASGTGRAPRSDCQVRLCDTTRGKGAEPGGCRPPRGAR